MVDGDHGEDDPAGLQLQAEPPRDNGFEAFYSERPAFLLARVDGDELAHLLDSRNGTPFDTPRDDEDGHTGVRRMHSASSRRSTGSPGKDKNARKPARWGAGFDEEFLDPGPVKKLSFPAPPCSPHLSPCPCHMWKPRGRTLKRALAVGAGGAIHRAVERWGALKVCR